MPRRKCLDLEVSVSVLPIPVGKRIIRKVIEEEFKRPQKSTTLPSLRLSVPATHTPKLGPCSLKSSKI
jgi:hypothetical protein